MQTILITIGFIIAFIAILFLAFISIKFYIEKEKLQTERELNQRNVIRQNAGLFEFPTDVVKTEYLSNLMGKTLVILNRKEEFLKSATDKNVEQLQHYFIALENAKLRITTKPTQWTEHALQMSAILTELKKLSPDCYIKYLGSTK